MARFAQFRESVHPSPPEDIELPFPCPEFSTVSELYTACCHPGFGLVNSRGVTAQSCNHRRVCAVGPDAKLPSHTPFTSTKSESRQGCQCFSAPAWCASRRQNAHLIAMISREIPRGVLCSCYRCLCRQSLFRREKRKSSVNLPL